MKLAQPHRLADELPIWNAAVRLNPSDDVRAGYAVTFSHGLRTAPVAFFAAVAADPVV